MVYFIQHQQQLYHQNLAINYHHLAIWLYFLMTETLQQQYWYYFDNECQSVSSYEQLFFYQLHFFVFWALSSWIFNVIFDLVSKFLFVLIFWIEWMLVTANKVKHMAQHCLHASQMPPWKTLVAQNFNSVSNKIKPTLVTRIVRKNIKVIHKNILAVHSKTLTRK